MNLSKYITYIEATKSETAIRKGIDNSPNSEQLEAMKHVAVNLFDAVREFVGAPVHPSSFFRCLKLNAAIGGAELSQHMKGEAIDMDCDKYGHGTNKEIFYFVKDNLEFDQLIWEFGDEKNPAWVHASLIKTGNRKEVLRAYRTASGGTIYQTFDLA